MAPRNSDPDNGNDLFFRTILFSWGLQVFDKNMDGRPHRLLSSPIVVHHATKLGSPVRYRWATAYVHEWATSRQKNAPGAMSEPRDPRGPCGGKVPPPPIRKVMRSYAWRDDSKASISLTVTVTCCERVSSKCHSSRSFLPDFCLSMINTIVKM